MGLDKWLPGRRASKQEIQAPLADAPVKQPDMSAADLGLRPDGTIAAKTPQEIEAAQWAERDKEAAEERAMVDEVVGVFEVFKDRLQPLFEQPDMTYQDERSTDKESPATRTDARSLLKELSADLKVVAEKHGVYVNPRQNPEVFKLNGVLPDDAGYSGKRNAFVHAVRRELQSYLRDIDVRFSSLSKERTGSLLQYSHRNEISQNSDALSRGALISGQLEREIFYDIFRDPRA